jgi:hypothetical protein
LCYCNANQAEKKSYKHCSFVKSEVVFEQKKDYVVDCEKKPVFIYTAERRA